MDSLIEKITLYDILGYGIPGCIFLIISGIGIFVNLSVDTLEKYKNYAGYLLFIFLILGYVCGILFSEVSRWIMNIIEKLLCQKEEIVEIGIVEQALIKSGFRNTAMGNQQLTHKDYMQMYSDIQTDPMYKRIHNYASAESMYKNMTVALLAGGLVNLIIASDLKYIQEICIVGAIIFGIRWWRFAKKKYQYAVLWFVKKQLGEREET